MQYKEGVNPWRPLFISKACLPAILRRESRKLLQQIFLQLGAPHRFPIAAPVKRAMAAGECSKEPVIEVKSNAKVFVHSAAYVYRPMMDVVQSPRRAEPGVQEWRAFHPETLNVHAVVKIAEHE